MKRDWPSARLEDRFDELEVEGIVRDVLGTGYRVLGRLGGGSRNVVVKVGQGSTSTHVIKLFCAATQAGAEVEAALGSRLASNVRTPPMTVHSLLREGASITVGVMPFIEGASAYHVLDGPIERRRAFAEKVGRILASIHDVRDSRAGLFGPDLSIVHPLDLSGEGLVAMITGALRSDLVRARLPTELIERVHRHAQQWCPRLDEHTWTPRLCHGDFGPENLLVDERGQVWVLDWEFAHSGTPWIDLGHLLRPRAGDDEVFVEALTRGYEAQAGPLPSDWKMLARIVDLTAWLEFLGRRDAPEIVLRDSIRMVMRLTMPTQP